MSRNPKLAVLSGAALTLSAGLAAVPAGAQEVVAELEQVVITGTHIRGAEVVGNVVQTLDADAIAESGRATVAEILRELPVNFAGGVATTDNNRGGQDTTSAGSNLTGGSGVNLRGLGALSTLVLVNGRRVAASGQFGDFVDISNIPTNAIERIEILQDGASAMYGSDAVAGVVNIILKRDVEGLELLARLGTMTQGGGDEVQLSATWGHGWDSGRVVVGYEYNDRSNVSADDRHFDNGNFSSRGGVNWPIYTNRAGSSANIFSAGAAFNGNVAYMVPPGPATGLTQADLLPATGGMGYSFDPWNGWDILPEMERHSVFLTADQDLGGRANLYGSVRYTSRDGAYRTGYPVTYTTLPATSPYFITGVTNNFGVLIDDELTKREVGVDSLGADLGVKFGLGGDWVGDVTVSYSSEEQSRKSQLLRDTNVVERLPNGTFAPSSLACSLMGLNSTNIGGIPAPTPAQTFCAGLNYTAYNPYTSNPLPAAVVSQLIGYEDLTFDSTLAQASAKVDGSLFSIPGGAVKLAVGLDYREEAIDGELDFNYRSINPATVPYGETKRDVLAAYAELAVPLVGAGNSLYLAKELDLSLAVRYEESSGLGDFDSTNPKFGVRWKPVDSLTLRGSYGTSFHAPPMRFMYDGPQPVPGGNAIFYANAFYTAPCNTNLVVLNGFTGTPGAPTGNCTFTGMVVSGGAGPVLKPEEAETWTVGFDFQPVNLEGLRISANYFDLEVENRLVRITSGTLAGILANYFATGSSPYISNLEFRAPGDDAASNAEFTALAASLMADPRFIGLSGPGPARTPDQIAGVISATQTNLATLRMDGVDISLNYDFSTSIGDFGLFAFGTWINTYEVQGTPGSAFVDKLGVYESTGNPVEWRTRQGVNYSLGGFDAGFAVNYTSDYACLSGCFVPGPTGAPVGNTSPIKIDDWITVDLRLGYHFDDSSGFLSNSGVVLSVINAFDEEPPFIDTGRVVTGNAPEPYDGTNATINGRSVSLTLTKRF